MESELNQTYGNRVRLRACGLLVEDNKLLLIKHLGLGKEGYFWSPVGGGVNFGESLEKTVRREFLEETGLEVEIEHFLFSYQFIGLPLHALEFFFLVRQIGGVLQRGTDPEMKKQIIDKVQFLSFEELLAEPAGNRHGIFEKASNLEELLAIRGLHGF